MQASCAWGAPRVPLPTAVRAEGDTVAHLGSEDTSKPPVLLGSWNHIWGGCLLGRPLGQTRRILGLCCRGVGPHSSPRRPARTPQGWMVLKSGCAPVGDGVGRWWLPQAARVCALGPSSSPASLSQSAASHSPGEGGGVPQSPQGCAPSSSGHSAADPSLHSRWEPGLSPHYVPVLQRLGRKIARAPEIHSRLQEVHLL